MPSKTLIETANRLRDIRRCGDYAIALDGRASVDMAALQERRATLVEEFREDRVDGLKDGDFDLLRGQACFTDEGRLKFTERDSGSSRVLQFGYALIATGSHPNVPDIPGLEGTPYWVSENALEAKQLPEHLIVIGGGAIGCEMACCFEGLGAKVTVLNRSRTLLSNLPESASRRFGEEAAKRGIDFRYETESKSVHYRDGQFKVTVEDAEGHEEQLSASHLLLATGRNPNTDSLELDQGNVLTEDGRILADGTGRTSNDRIYAAGDCVKGPSIVHRAVLAGEQAARNIHAKLRGHSDSHVEVDLDPSITAVFSEPELIHIGPSSIDSSWLKKTFDLADSGKAIIQGKQNGQLELFLEPGSKTIKAATGVGRGVIDYSQAVVLAIRAEMTLEQFLSVPHYHPTMSEAWTYFESA